MMRQSLWGNILSMRSVFTKIAHPFKNERSNVMNKIRTTLTILIFILLFIVGLSLVTNYYSSPSPHISQQENMILYQYLIDYPRI